MEWSFSWHSFLIIRKNQINRTINLKSGEDKCDSFYQTMVGSKSPLPSSTPVNHRPFISRNETFLLGRETRLPSSFPLSLVAPANPFWTLSWRTSDNNMHRRQASFGSISRLLYHSIALLGRNRVLLQVWKLDHENWITCSQ